MKDKPKLQLESIFDISYYRKTKILLVSAKLDIYSALATNRMTAQEIADLIGSDKHATEIFLNALVAIGTLEKKGEKYKNMTLSQKYLVSTSKHYIGHTLLLQDDLWGLWGQLEEVIKTGKSPFDESVWENPKIARKIIRSVHIRAIERASCIAKKINLYGYETMIDVGGGAGTYSVSFCKENPNLKAFVYDFPFVLDIAKEVIREHKLKNRIKLIPCDIYSDEIKGSFDVALISNVIHEAGTIANMELLKKVYNALNENGKLIIHDRILDESKTYPPEAAILSVNMLLNTQNSRCYSASEIKNWLLEAGFRDISKVKENSIIEAVKL